MSKKLKNRYFINYNLRYHPVLQFIRKYIKIEKFILFNLVALLTCPIGVKSIILNLLVLKKVGRWSKKLELSHEIDYLLWIFGNFSTLFSLNKKISNLKMNCDDILLLIGLSKKKTLINLNLNFFFKRGKKRNIYKW